MNRLPLVVSILLFSVAAFAQNLAFQGFEVNTGDWDPTIPSQPPYTPVNTTFRVPSGGGVLHLTAAAGLYYAEVHNIDNDYIPGYYGDSGYSEFGFATPPAYPGDFSQSIEMYIDVTWPLALYGMAGVWIDESPGNYYTGNYGGEHNFRITPTGTGTVYIYVDGLPSIATITTSGWYNFEMTFQKGATPASLVNTVMSVFNSSGHLVGSTTVLSNSPGGPLLSQDLMGPGYVWITVWPNGWANDVLAIDNVRADLLAASPSYFVSYYSDANTTGAPDATVRAVNDGDSAGDLYAAIYVFDDSEELQECCACKVTQNGLLSESVDKDLTATPLTGIKPARGVIKVISSATSDPTNLVPSAGLRAWATHIQKASTNTYALTEAPFATSNLSSTEATLLQNLCYYDGQLSGAACTCTPEDSDF